MPDWSFFLVGIGLISPIRLALLEPNWIKACDDLGFVVLTQSPGKIAAAQFNVGRVGLLSGRCRLG
jgi:hypothetical protein